MDFFIIVGQQQQGPYTVDELRHRHIAQDTLVWTRGMDQWTPAWQVDALRCLFAPDAGAAAGDAPSVTPPPGTAEQPAGSTPEPADACDGPAAAPHRSHRFGRWAAVAVAVAAMFIALVATCPSPDAHRQKVGGEISHLVNEVAGGATDAWGLLGTMIASHVVDLAVDQMLTVDNYMVCSVGRLHYLGTTKTVSLGILGHVFTFGHTDVEKAMHPDTPDGSGDPSAPDNSTGGEEEGESM